MNIASCRTSEFDTNMESNGVVPQIDTPQNHDNEINLYILIQLIWENKLWIFITALMSAAVAWSIAARIPDVYRSEVLLAPVSEERGAAMGGLAGQLGGLAGLAGIDLGGSSINKATLGLEVLRSRAFLIRFIQDNELLVPLLAAKGWDSVAKKWIFDESKYDANKRQWVRHVKPPRTVQPSELEAYKELTRLLSVSQDKKTQIIRISIESLSPVLAKEWAEKLVFDLNEHVRSRDVEEAQRSINYLQKQLSATAVAEMRNILFQLIEQQTKTIMLAEVRAEYVFQVIDPAVIPEEKAGPKRVVIIAVSTCLATLLCTVILIMIGLSRKDKGRKTH